MNEGQRAVRLLNGGTLAVVNGERAQVFCERGIKALMGILHSDASLLDGASVADKVVGKAAALLMIKGGVKEVYAELISSRAEEVLRAHGVSLSYGDKCERIVNRAGDGFCPMESAVWDTEDPDEAYILLEKAVKNMAKK